MEFAPAGATHPYNEIPSALRILLLDGQDPYTKQLRQYRGAGYQVTFSGYNLFPPAVNFTNPFTLAQVEEFVRALVINRSEWDPPGVCGTVPCLYMPTGWKYEDSNTIGFHSYIQGASLKYPYIVLTDNGNMDDLTVLFTHELVETVTDPTGEGFRADQSVCGGGDGWCELCDICSGTGHVGGVLVSSYYSTAAGQCIIPSD